MDAGPALDLRARNVERCSIFATCMCTDHQPAPLWARGQAPPPAVRRVRAKSSDPWRRALRWGQHWSAIINRPGVLRRDARIQLGQHAADTLGVGEANAHLAKVEFTTVLHTVLVRRASVQQYRWQKRTNHAGTQNACFGRWSTFLNTS